MTVCRLFLTVFLMSNHPGIAYWSRELTDGDFVQTAKVTAKINNFRQDTRKATPVVQTITRLQLSDAYNAGMAVCRTEEGLKQLFSKLCLPNNDRIRISDFATLLRSFVPILSDDAIRGKVRSDSLRQSSL